MAQADRHRDDSCSGDPSGGRGRDCAPHRPAAPHGRGGAGGGHGPARGDRFAGHGLVRAFHHPRPRSPPAAGRRADRGGAACPGAPRHAPDAAPDARPRYYRGERRTPGTLDDRGRRGRVDLDQGRGPDRRGEPERPRRPDGAPQDRRHRRVVPPPARRARRVGAPAGAPCRSARVAHVAGRPRAGGREHRGARLDEHVGSRRRNQDHGKGGGHRAGPCAVDRRPPSASHARRPLGRAPR